MYIVQPTSIFLSFSSDSLYNNKYQNKIISMIHYASIISNYLMLLSSEDAISIWIDCSGDIGVSITWTSFEFNSNDSSLRKKIKDNVIYNTT